MNWVAASLAAMVCGWALPIAGLVAFELAPAGRTADVGVTAFWTGLFGLVGWSIGVLPVLRLWRNQAIFRDGRFSWLGWTLLGATIYGVTVVPLFGAGLLQILWYPAAMGAIAGSVFARLYRPAPPRSSPKP